MKISLTNQQKERLVALQKSTGLTYAEIIRRAFDSYPIDKETEANI